MNKRLGLDPRSGPVLFPGRREHTSHHYYIDRHYVDQVKSWKGQPIQRRLLALVKQVDGFQDCIAYDLQALGAQLVHGVLRGMVEDVVVAIV